MVKKIQQKIDVKGTSSFFVLLFVWLVVVMIGIVLFWSWRRTHILNARIDDSVKGSLNIIDKTFEPLVEGGTRTAFTYHIPTPERDAVSLPGGVGAPYAVIQKSSYTLRRFIMKGDAGSYSPRILVVNDGDVVNVEFEAIDADYTFYSPDFQIFRFISKGSKAQIEFFTSPFGQYSFFCKDVCGKDDLVKGVLVVNRKE